MFKGNSLEVLDITTLCQPLTDNQPAGENLEYDPRFLYLTSLAAGKERQEMGNSVIEAETPDWRHLRETCLELSTITRDLRVTIYLTLAQMQLEGVTGYVAGLEIINCYLNTLWDSFYPLPDEDDPTDLLERMNTLAWLSPAPGSYGDPFDFPGRLRETLVCQTKIAGRVILRDILVISGDLTLPEEAARPDEAQIEAVFMDAGAEAVGETVAAFAKALELFERIEKTASEKGGANAVPDLSIMKHLLKRGHELIRQRWVTLAGVDEDEEAEEDKTASDGNQGGISGKIHSRSDVNKMLQKIIAYYQMNEPGSPVPFLLKRALKMVDMNFVDLMQELTPESMEKLTVVMGREIAPREEQ